MASNPQTVNEHSITSSQLASRARGRTATRAGRIAVMVIFTLFVLLPIIFMFTTSVKDQIEIRATGALFPQQGLHLINWVYAWTTVPLASYLFNSTLTALVSTALVLLIAIPTTYSIVRFKIGGDILPSMILGGYVMPPIVVSIPIFMMIKALGLPDTKLGMILVHTIINAPIAVWLLDSFVRTIPKELEEAAWIDGYSRIGTLIKVVLPLILPGLIATGIICMILSWNEFLLALLITSSPQGGQTFPVGVARYTGQHGLQFGEMSAAALSGMIPIYILVFIFQRFVVAGLTRGGVKG